MEITKYNGSIGSFSTLLEEGKIAEALQFRLESIEASARAYRQDLESAKISSAALGVVGLFLSANPLVAVLAGCGLLGYGYSLYQDFQMTKRFCPVPLLRKTAGELLTGIGMIASNEDSESNDPLLNVIGYVEPDLAHEYELLMVAESQLAGYLTSLPADRRLNAYRHILRHTRLRNSLKLPSLQEVHAATAYGTAPTAIPSVSAAKSLPSLHSEPVIDVSAQRMPPTEAFVDGEEYFKNNPPSPSDVSADAGTSQLQEPTQSIADDAITAQPQPEKVSIPVVESTRVHKQPKTSQKIEIKLFDFTRLKSEPDKFAHLRVIGGTGIGKTTFVDWLLDILGGERFVITPKKKPWHWQGLKVYGLWFDYQAIRERLQWIHTQMYHRFPLMNVGQTFEITNFVVDEWRLINMNVRAIKEKDPETNKVVEVAPSAKALMKDIITIARESMLRMIALAQGEQVETWGFGGESDLEECFTDIRLGDFAIDYAKILRSQCRKDSEEYEYGTAILVELKWQESRRTEKGKSIPCCMVGRIPARIPNLSNWKRSGVDESTNNELQPKVVNVNDTAPPDEPAIQNQKEPTPDAEMLNAVIKLYIDE